MKISLVPSTVTPGTRGTFVTSYLINEVVAVDAGGLGLLGDLEAQRRVKHVFLTHSHMDHVGSLPFFLDTVFEPGGPCVTLHALATTLESLRRDLFNDRVWPDFIGMAERGIPLLEIDVLQPGRPVRVSGLTLTPIEMDHTVPTVGFLVQAPDATVALCSDTGPTTAFWHAAGQTANLKAVFLEASFPDEMHRLAVDSGHLTPAAFALEVGKLNRRVPFIAVHIKPRFFDRTVAELRKLDLHDLQIGRPGDTFVF